MAGFGALKNKHKFHFGKKLQKRLVNFKSNKNLGSMDELLINRPQKNHKRIVYG